MTRFKRGQMLVAATPQGAEDRRIAKMKCGRVAGFLEYTATGYARVFFYGDAKNAQYMMHPESFRIA